MRRAIEVISKELEATREREKQLLEAMCSKYNEEIRLHWHEAFHTCRTLERIRQKLWDIHISDVRQKCKDESSED